MTTSQNRIRRRFSDDLERKLCQDQDYRCMYCGRKRAFSDLEIDHKKPVQREGSDNVRNLQVLCPPCNKRKGNQTDQEFRRRYRELLPKTKQPPESAIRQDAFDMVTATTNRSRAAQTNQSPRSAEKTPAVIESLSIRREVGLFSDAIKLEWSTPDSNEPITGYRIQFRVVSGAPITDWRDSSNPHQGNLPSFELNQVPQPPRFAFRIQTSNKNGWGLWSEPFPETGPQNSTTKEESKPIQVENGSTDTPKGDPPASITEVSFERIPGILTDAVIARWTTPESEAGPVNGYSVQFRMHQGQKAREWTDSSPRHDGRNPSYRFNNVPKPQVNQSSVRIRAKNDTGWGTWSQEFPDTTV